MVTSMVLRLSKPAVFHSSPLSQPSDSRSVITIHGLGTNSSTWEFKKRDGDVINWLSDSNMLPAAIPEARIFTYDWDANYTDNALVGGLDVNAGRMLLLINELRDRKDHQKRPIVFVASCFGGLILAEVCSTTHTPGAPNNEGNHSSCH